MEKIKLTKTVVAKAVAKPSRYSLFDTQVPGFGLRVFPTGAMSWIFEYRPGEGGRRVAKKRITIGKVDDFTPEVARKIADGYRAMVRTGHDPQGEKARQRKALTVSELATAFLSDHVDAKRKASTKAHYEDVLNRLVVPKLGQLKAKDVTRADIARLHLASRKTPFQANRILAIVGSMYGFGAKHGLVPDDLNPARGVERYKEEGRERYLSGEELERLGAAIREAETTGIPWKINPAKKTKHVPKERQATVIGEHAAAALRLLIFTGARVGEILTLKWEHVDFERGLLRLPDSKTGQKTIILNAPAMGVLTHLTRAGVYVIAGDSVGKPDEKPRSDLKRPWSMVRRHAKLDRVRLHDLRHNFAAFGAGGGLGLPIIGKLLGHSQPQTTARYAHLDNDPLRRATDSIGATLANAMGEKRESGQVISLDGHAAPNR
ncbi:tyrosine-type recombinase/integrase [Neoaquamicrobium sediminum]|uniref:Site-specific integrase n=1 Tax=Neoaquamicrobium sediminum TaxID=1849104 RepID=A0ABV3WRJ4_9HYPH